MAKKIAFMSSKEGNNEIYVMDADGSNQSNLTNNDGYDDFPNWSPDGTKIAFASARDGNVEIYVMDVE
jgi:Tol biopolymer transport system component